MYQYRRRKLKSIKEVVKAYCEDQRADVGTCPASCKLIQQEPDGRLKIMCSKSYIKKDPKDILERIGAKEI